MGFSRARNPTDSTAVAEAVSDTRVKVLVAVADVTGIVKKGSAIDEHARQNTTSVYTAGGLIPMLPEKLSTDLTSLNYHADREALGVVMVIGDGGGTERSDIYRARVRNQANLSYNSAAARIEGTGTMPAAVAAVPGMAENLQLQDRVAQLCCRFIYSA